MTSKSESDQQMRAPGAAARPGIGWPRRLRRRGYWLLAVTLLAVAERMPLEAGRLLGRGLARLGLRLRGRERGLARRNLALALPDLDDTSRERLLRRAVDRLGENLFDTLAMLRLLERSGFVTEEAALRGDRPDFASTLRELAHDGRGVLILTGHLGCWELLGGWLARAVPGAGCGPLAVVTGTIHNPAVDRLVQARRRRTGLKVLPRGDGIRPLLEHLRGGGVAAVLLDQNTRVQNRPVPFFGRPAPTPAAIGRIALRDGIPLLPVAIARGGEGHVVRRLEAIRPPAGTAKEDEAALDALLGRCNAALEEMIRRNPAEWVWFHRRWHDEGWR